MSELSVVGPHDYGHNVTMTSTKPTRRVSINVRIEYLELGVTDHDALMDKLAPAMHDFLHQVIEMEFG